MSHKLSDMKFLGQKLSNTGNCIKFDLITKKYIKEQSAGIVGSMCSDAVRNLFFHIPQFSLPL